MTNQKLNIKGFFDLQVNGYKGIDFSSSELTEDAFVYASVELEKTGTIGFLPTIITSSPEIYEKNLKIISKVRRYKAYKNLVAGIHLEGPFISPEDGYKGIHPAEHIKKPSIPLLEKLTKWSSNNIKLLTIAAEAKDADKLCHYATSKKILVSLGHQQANEKEINKITTSGARTLTHLGNGIPHLINRHINPLWSGLANDKLSAMIIADGFHLPVSLIKTIIKVKGIKNTVLVSDISPVGGLKSGNYKLWNCNVKLLPNGFLYNPSTGYLAGSSFTLTDSANYILSENIAALKDVYKMAFHNPLRLLGINPLQYKNLKKITVLNNKVICEK